MKKFISLLLCFIMLFSLVMVNTTSVCAAEKPIKVKLCNYMDNNGKWVKEKYINFDVKPQIIDGRTMVPVRAVAEELGYSVAWDNKAQQVMFQRFIDIDKKSKNYYDNYNQLKRAVNLFYRLEGGEKISNFSSFRYCGGHTHTKLPENQGWVVHSDTLKYLAVGDILGRKTDAKKYLESYLKVGSKKACSHLYDTSLGYLEVSYKMDVAPTVIDGRTLIPLRAMSELLGLDVTWDDSNKNYNLVTISA